MKGFFRSPPGNPRPSAKDGPTPASPITGRSRARFQKRGLVHKDLDEYSLETVKMFRNDAVKAGFQLRSSTAP